jgi:hypothetical protein
MINIHQESLFLFKNINKPTKNDRAEHNEIEEGNERQPDPDCFFTIGCSMEDIRVAGQVFLLDSKPHDEKEKKNDKA